ncbi:hypothetical protein GCM10009859_19640 [Kocuria salsicia]
MRSTSTGWERTGPSATRGMAVVNGAVGRAFTVRELLARGNEGLDRVLRVRMFTGRGPWPGIVAGLRADSWHARGTYTHVTLM